MMSNVPEYNVENLSGDWIKGPMKWIVVILGSNHKAADITSLLRSEYKNLNIIVVMVTNNHQNQGFRGGDTSKLISDQLSASQP